MIGNANPNQPPARKGLVEQGAGAGGHTDARAGL